MKWIQQWKEDVKALETQVREIKARLRKDWTVSYADEHFNSAADQYNLLKLKFTLTHMYAFRGTGRPKNAGKIHADLSRNRNGFKVPDMSKYIKLRDEEIEQRKQLQTRLDLEAIHAANAF